MSENTNEDAKHLELIKFVIKQKENHPEWTKDQIIRMNMDLPIPTTLQILKNMQDFDLDEELWLQAVDEALGHYENRVKLAKDSELLSVSDSGIRLIEDPSNNHEYWNQYRELLERTLGFQSTELISASCDNVLKRLSNNGPQSIKGLVHGSVQSGKTANMEGIIAKAADAGFNVFIVFTGNLTTLNDQTERRFRQDLSGKYQFTFRSPADISKYQLIDPQAKTICVTLKTTSKLKLINNWLADNPHRNNLKVLIIDDEADYASVNGGVSEEKRTITNRLMMKLVNQTGLEPRYGAMNYVAFTATPYPNLLNESGPDSLYPHNFIISLPNAASYLGPQRIFGASYGCTEYPGLPIVVKSHDLDTEFRKLEKGKIDEPTEELKESLAWFLSAVAAMRYRGYKKPLTFMVNTTHNVDPHVTVARALIDYIDSPENRPEIMEYCRIVYGRETANFPKEVFTENCPDYPRELLDRIEDYPNFDDIVPYIEELLSDKCHHIKNEDGHIKYYRTLHICIENGQEVNLEDDESVYISRIRYPQEGDECPDAPAFIVIGGNVLSRGLTLVGLVTSFFLRPATTADTLMQMGRWFGFRHGYELYPRIWMSNRSFDDYSFLAQLDEEVREEIRECNRMGSDPSKTAIRLLNIPRAKSRGFLRGLCARNKMKASIASNVSFIGKYEEFTRFRNEADILDNNIAVARSFLSGLSEYGPNIPAEDDWNVVRWNNVPSSTVDECFFSKIRDGLLEDSDRSFQLEMLIKWMGEMEKKGVLRHWNVLLAGTAPDNPSKNFEVCDGIRIGKITRSKELMTKDEKAIYIKTLRNRPDLFKDVFPGEFTDKYLLTKIRKGEIDTELRLYERQTEWVGNTPLLIIYCIDKDSKPRNGKHGSSEKVALDSVSDVISFLIEVPNIDTQDGDMVQVKLDLDKIGEEDDL